MNPYLAKLYFSLSLALLAIALPTHAEDPTTSSDNQEHLIENNHIVLQDGFTFAIQDQPQTEEQEKLFSNLTDAEKSEFFRVRNRNLGRAITVLYKAPRKIVDYERMQNIIHELNSRHWNFSPLYVKPPKEAGTLFSGLGSLGLGSALTKAFFLLRQYGMGFGYNKEAEKFYLEIFKSQENLKKVFTYVGTACIGARGGLRFRVLGETCPSGPFTEHGTAMTIVGLGALYTSANGQMIVSGVGVDANIIPWGQVYTTDWSLQGYRWNFNLPNFVKRRLNCEKKLSQ